MYTYVDITFGVFWQICVTDILVHTVILLCMCGAGAPLHLSQQSRSSDRVQEKTSEGPVSTSNSDERRMFDSDVNLFLYTFVIGDDMYACL